MSYILDALRKADQQRQRGATPMLLLGAPTEPRPGQAAYFLYGLLAAVLLGAGVAIGWLRPWQAEPPVPAADRIAPKTAAEHLGQAAAPAATPAPPQPRLHHAAPQQGAAPAPVGAKAHSLANVGSETPGVRREEFAVIATQPALPSDSSRRAAATETAPAQNVISLAELPLALRQELPPMTISVHAYSATPGDRLVGINNHMLREGDSVAPGLKLEQITPEGMVLGYRGYRFRRGVK